MDNPSSTRRELALALILLLAAMPAAAGTIHDIEPNDTFATAQVIPRKAFTRDFDPNIFNSTTIRHATILGNGKQPLHMEFAQFDFYRFTMKKDGAIILDIDNAPIETDVDTAIALFTGAELFLAGNDDFGGDPGDNDTTVGGILNSGLTTAVLPKGDYVVRVGAFGNTEDRTLDPSETYTLHVSAAGLQVPSPTALVLIGMGIFPLAVGMWRRRR